MPGPTVKQFYERFPYPMRAADHASSPTILPSSFDAIRHHLFDGHWPAGKPFRALVAGGGTGDAVLGLGRSMARRGIDGHIHYIDLSATSADIARRRAAEAGLHDVSFEVGPVEAVADGAAGRFDYVDLSGVLPYVVEPTPFLDALCHVLADDGGIGVMSYGRLGRHGVEPFREIYAALAPDGTVDVEVARTLVAALPESNPLRRNPRLGRDLDRVPDIELADRLLAPHEFAYTVTELDTLFRRSGFAIGALVPGLIYDPARFLRDAGLRDRLERLSRIERAQLAENLQGDMNKHVFYATKGDRVPATVDAMLDRGGDRAVLLPRQMDAAALASRIGSSPTVSLAFTVDGTERRVTIRADDGVRRFLEHVDAEPTVGELRHRIGGDDPDATIRYMARALAAIEALHVAIP